MKQRIEKRQRIYYYEQHKVVDSFAEEIHQGLTQPQKTLPPKYFYDEHGSKLFDKICKLPEYYPTRTEIAMLQRNAHEFAEMMGQNSILFELGSGSSVKIRILLEALQPKVYVPLDISKDHLIEAANQLAKDYPWLEVHANRVDYSQPWQIPDFGPGRYNAFFPGSSIGNFDPMDAKKLLVQISKLVGAQGGLLIGVDLKKDRATLEAAYNDSQGITARFNLNMLDHINQRLNAKIDTDNFTHKALYNEQLGRIEMHLKSEKAQKFVIGDAEYTMIKDETIHTESSYKYSVADFHQLATEAGFEPIHTWLDDKRLFSIHFLRACQ